MSMEEKLTAKITSDVTEAVEGIRQVRRESVDLQRTIKQVGISFSGVVSAGMALYGNYERIRNAQIALAAAAKEVHESEVTIAGYRKSLIDATQRYGASSQEVALFLERISVNEELLAVKEQRLRVAHESVAKSYIFTAATIIPNLITGVESVANLYTVLKGATAAATVTQWLYNKALMVAHALSGPVGWAILGIAGAVTAGAIAWTAMNRQQQEYNRTLSETTREFRSLDTELSAISPIERLQRQYQIVKEYYGYTVSVGNVNVAATNLGSPFDRERTAEDVAKKVGHKLALKVITR